jgi:hypothetical protein
MNVGPPRGSNPPAGRNHSSLLVQAGYCAVVMRHEVSASVAWPTIAGSDHVQVHQRVKARRMQFRFSNRLRQTQDPGGRLSFASKALCLFCDTGFLGASWAARFALRHGSSPLPQASPGQARPSMGPLAAALHQLPVGGHPNAFPTGRPACVLTNTAGRATVKG